MELAFLPILVWVLILLGLAGTLLPVLPGTGLVFAGILVHAYYFGVDSIGFGTLILFGVVTALSFVIDLLASLYGASRFGASRFGLIGSILGGLIGTIFLSLPGLFFGFILGAIIGELLLGHKSLNDALKAGVGSALGFFGGTIFKFFLTLVMVMVFAWKTWF